MQRLSGSCRLVDIDGLCSAAEERGMTRIRSEGIAGTVYNVKKVRMIVSANPSLSSLCRDK